VKAQREKVEARRDELVSWVRSEAADRTQAEELAAKWPDWAHAHPIVARQALGKLLAGAPVYVVPGAEKRTWHFVGLASYEGALRGAVRPGYIATYADDMDPYPIVSRAAARPPSKPARSRSTA
jgi:hypothetical protein